MTFDLADGFHFSPSTAPALEGIVLALDEDTIMQEIRFGHQAERFEIQFTHMLDLMNRLAQTLKDAADIAWSVLSARG